MCNSKRISYMVLLLALLVTGTAIQADETTPTGWKKSLMVDITTTQTSYSNSWVGGEAGSVNWVGNLNGSAEMQLKEWFNFRSVLKLSFGQTMTQTADSTKHWSKPQKSTDMIDWENVGRFTLQKSVDPFAAFRLESQFLDASVEAKKRFFTPIKLTESVGIARQFYAQEKDEVISRLGLALRQIMKNTIVDEQLNTEDSTLIDGGIESVTDVTLTFNERLRYTGKLTLYKALYFSNKDEVKGTEFEDDWKAIDVNWENIISASLSKIITVNLYTQLLYDKEVSRKSRIKETLAIGFVFKML